MKSFNRNREILCRKASRRKSSNPPLVGFWENRFASDGYDCPSDNRPMPSTKRAVPFLHAKNDRHFLPERNRYRLLSNCGSFFEFPSSNGLICGFRKDSSMKPARRPILRMDRKPGLLFFGRVPALAYVHPGGGGGILFQLGNGQLDGAAAAAAGGEHGVKAPEG